MATVKYTVSVDSDLVKQFKAICKARGRTQSFYITAAMRRVLGDGEGAASAPALRTQGGASPRKRKRG